MLGPALAWGPADLAAQHPVPATSGAANQPGAGHAVRANPAGPAASAFGGRQERFASRRTAQETVVAEQNGVRVAFQASDVGGGPVRAGHEATLDVTLARTGSGAPFAGLEIAAWLDRRQVPGSTPGDACKAKVDKFVQAGITMEGALRARPVEDLNSYLVVTLNRSADLAVLDPFFGFGRTKLRTAVPLRSPGADWALSPDGRRLFVSMPDVGAVAVVDVGTWKVVANVPVRGRPARLALAPDGARLWVLPERTERPGSVSGAARDTVTVLALASLDVVARVPVGTRPLAIAFDAGDRAYVANGGSGTVSVVDARRLTPVVDVDVGAAPASIVYSKSAGAAYVLAGGVLVAVDGVTGRIAGRVPVGAGARSVRAAPAAGAGHSHGRATDRAATTADGAPTAPAAHDVAAAGGRWLFVTDSAARAVHIVDAPARRVFRTVRYEHAPDQVAFTSAFAYVRFGDSPKVSMISLDDPRTGGVGTMDVFEAGRDAPTDASGELADAIAAAPDMPDAIYALNAAERMIYYYHYMEGMPIPSGGLTTYSFEPRAVMTVGKAMRERAPGAFTATVRLTEEGEYDLVMLVGAPRIVQCMPFSVAADPLRMTGRPSLRLRTLDPARTLRTGGDTFRFELADRRRSGAPVTVPDVRTTLVSATGWRQDAPARLTAGGVYEVLLTAPAPGAYFLSVAVPSLGVTVRDVPTTIVHAIGGSAR